MFRTRSVVLSSALTMLLAACSEDSTGPAAPNIPQEVPSGPAAANIPHTPSMVATSIEGLSFNSGSCTLANSTTGEVRCSWDITNTSGKSLDYWPEAELAVSYNCLDSRGQIRSSGIANMYTYLSYFGVTSTSITGTNQQLPTRVPYNGGTGNSKKYNACKSGQQLQITGYALQYWDIWVEVEGESECLGSDSRYNCYVMVRL